MIDKLKWLIDQCEQKPKLKELLLKVAELPEDKQEAALELIRMVLESMNDNEGDKNGS